VLAGQVQDLPARAEHRELCPGREQIGDDRGDGIDDMLEVVEDQKHSTFPDERRECFPRRATETLRHSQRRSDGRWYEFGRPHFVQHDRGCSVRELVRHTGGRLQSQPALTDAARSDERH
jgi:hypothetical protein